MPAPAGRARHGNSEDLAGAVGSVYGEEAGEAFLGLWRSHIGMFVDYTKATAAGNTTARQKAVDDLTGYAHDFAVFLNGANDQLPVETVEGLVLEHVTSTKAAVDAVAAGEPDAFSTLREAGQHMSMIADPLAQAIVAQFPDKFGGDPASPAADLRTTLNLMLAEHTQLAGAAVNGALKGNTAEFEAAAGALDGNSEDLASAVGSVYGEDDTVRIAMEGDGHATLVWSPSLQRAVLVADGLPRLPNDRVFQLWLFRDGVPSPSEVFTAHDGRGIAVASAPDGFDGAAVTVEPPGGVPTPTSPIILASA